MRNTLPLATLATVLMALAGGCREDAPADNAGAARPTGPATAAPDAKGPPPAPEPVPADLIGRWTIDPDRMLALPHIQPRLAQLPDLREGLRSGYGGLVLDLGATTMTWLMDGSVVRYEVAVTATKGRTLKLSAVRLPKKGQTGEKAKKGKARTLRLERRAESLYGYRLDEDGVRTDELWLVRAPK